LQNYHLLQIALVVCQGDKVILTGRAELEKPPSSLDTKWTEHINKMTLVQDWNLKIEIFGSDHIIWVAIQNSKALAVSDRSFQEQHGACTWIIESKNSENQIIGTMSVPGNQGHHSSFRSKAPGIYRLLLTVWYLLKDEHIQGMLMVACDGKSVLDRLQSRKIIDPFAAHVDLLCACKHILAQLPCQVKFHHVRGHQDKGLPTVLQCDPWLNIEVDLRAKASIKMDQMEWEPKPIPMEPWVMIISNGRIVKNQKREIRWVLNSPPAQQYWKSKLPSLSPSLHKLDTDVMERAISKTHPT